jgi:protein N-terminal methyltransferase
LALDCGAGIGRVSKHLLLKNFDYVEMVEVTKNFIDQATSYLGEELSKRVQKFHNCGLESFYPEPNKYDCIWVGLKI